MCVLCKDTFSRSDILKRHFQKCSIRRGNPPGASHLSHAQAHLKRSHPGPHKPATTSTNAGMNGLHAITNDAVLQHPFGVIPIPYTASNLTDEQAALRALKEIKSPADSVHTVEDRVLGPSDCWEQKCLKSPTSLVSTGSSNLSAAHSWRAINDKSDEISEQAFERHGYCRGESEGDEAKPRETCKAG